MPLLEATPGLRALCLAGAAALAVQVLFLVEPPIAHRILAHVWDKAVHFLYFGVMAAFFSIASGGRRPVGVWILVAAIGALDETQQLFTPGRTADIFDWLADALGAATALATLRFAGAFPCAES